MNTPYGLEIVENCTNCKLKREDCLCNLSAPVLKIFSTISHQTTFPPDATLFVEGQSSRGGVSAVLRKGEALHQFTGWQGADFEDGGPGGDAGG